MIGQKISHYEIIEKLGEGGMGVVYKAHDTELERNVALKFLPKYLTSDATEKERFYHEARAASSLNHPNITTIHEIKEFEGQLFLAMEYVEGTTLKALAEGNALSVKKVLEIGIQVCDGLTAAHEKHIVHRDIKSDNIMITPKGQVKIMDFGLAKVKGATKLTKAGSTIGTAAYMSPEQAQGEEIDHRSDIFSFGVVLYELLTGKLPFRGEHQAAMMYSLINEAPQPIARFNEKAGQGLENIVAKALAKERDERYQHVDDLLADLRRERKNLEYARAGYATTSTVSQSAFGIPASPAPGQRNRNLTRYAIIGGVIIAAVVVVAIFNPFNFQISTQKSAAAERNTLAVMYFQNIPDPSDKDHTGDMLADLLITALSQTNGLEVISRERLFDIQKELQADAKAITPEQATKIAQRAGVTTMLLGSILQKEPELALTIRLIDTKSGNIIRSERVTGFTTARIFPLVDTLALLVRNYLQVKVTSPAETKSIAEVTTSSPEAYRSYLEGVELNKRFYASEAVAAFRRAIELDSTFAMAYFQLSLVNLSTLSGNEVDWAMGKALALSARISERERLLIEAQHAWRAENDPAKAQSLLEQLLRKYPRESSARTGLAILCGTRGEFVKMNEVYAEGVRLDSLDKNNWNSMAYSNAGLDRRADALNAAERYLQLAPAEPNPYDSKGDIYAQFDDRDSACIWWKKATAFRPDYSSVVKLLQDAVVRQDSADVALYIPKSASAYHADELTFREVLAPIVLASRGQLKKAQSAGKKFLDARLNAQAKGAGPKDTRNVKNPGAFSANFENLIAVDYELRDVGEMVRDAQAYSNFIRPDSATNPTYGRITLAVAMAKSGNSKAAAALIEQSKQSRNNLNFYLAGVDFGEGLISFDAGNYSAALAQMTDALHRAPPRHAPIYFHAVALLKNSKTEDAMAELNRLVRWAPIHFLPYDLDVLPLGGYAAIGAMKAHYWLGVAYEELGDKGRAINEHEKFLEVWKDADFDSPEMKDARLRLSKLKGTASR